MSFVNGRKDTCDRCKKEIFRKCTGEGEMDGGFTRWNNFEPMPPGWEWHVNIGLLCDECNEQYQRLIGEFMRGVSQ